MSRIRIIAVVLVVTTVVLACGNAPVPQPLQATQTIGAITLSTAAQNPNLPFAAGQVVNYQYTITNTGTVALAGPATVVDNKTAVVCPAVTTVGNLNANLDQGEVLVCTGSYALTQADVTAGSVTNTATATIAGTISQPFSLTIKPPENKVLAITKTASTTTFSQAGQTVNFTYVVTNTGAAPLGPAQFVVTDDHIPAPINCGAPATLAQNQTVTCSAAYTITQADVTAGTVTNSASASGAGATSAQPARVTLTLAGAPVPGPSNLTPGSTIQYKVIKGEWVIQIARCFGADPKAITRANPPLTDRDEISPDQVLTIPNIGSNGKIYGPPCLGSHTVQAGDTWNSIAAKYNADVAVLQAANLGKGLTAGTVLRIPLNSAGGVPVTGATQSNVTPSPSVCNQASLVTDVNIPDGTTLAPGSTFTKTWQLKNMGTCTWTNGYLLIFDHGEAMGAPATTQLTTVNVPPGGTVDVSIHLQAPPVPGTYQADFRLRSPEGVVFGIGSNGQGTFWVKIVVAGSATVGVPTTAIPTTASAPSVNPFVTAIPTVKGETP